MLRILLIILLAPFMAKPQNFGGFPPRTKWQQIQTDTARIIFSAGARRQATLIATIVHRMAASDGMGFSKSLKRIPIVLHHETTQANGYVALGPFRSEFYLIPPADIFAFGNLPWQENLAVHEYRHVQQYNAFNRGWVKAFSVLGGQNGRALANALAVPDWFFEGDAVYEETAFTGLGRGVQPQFQDGFKALWQGGKTYGWMKLRNGSLKDYVPNHYQLGYLLVNEGYTKWGDAFWKKVSIDAASFKQPFYPFQSAFKKHAGILFKQFRNEALDHYKKRATPEKEVSALKEVTHYYYPQTAGKDSLIYAKETYKNIAAFYIKDIDGEHKLKQRSITNDEWFHYLNGQLVYTAYATHPRWSLIDYSDIVILDVQTGKEKRLTHGAKYFTPSFAPDGRAVLAVAINDSLETEMHLLDSESGKLLQKIRPRNGDYFTQPVFIDVSTIAAGVRNREGAMSLQVFNMANGAAEVLIAPQKATIGNPRVQGDTLYFTAGFTGNDEVFACTLKDKKLFQLTQSYTGNYEAAVISDSLVWTHITHMGRELKKKALQNLIWKAWGFEKVGVQNVYQPRRFSNRFPLQNERDFAVKKLPKAKGLFHVHSWDPGGNVYSNNILNTMAAQLYYRYSNNERSHTAGAQMRYGGLFPVINAGVEKAFHRPFLSVDTIIRGQSLRLQTGASLPLNFSRGSMYKFLNAGLQYVFEKRMPAAAWKALPIEKNIQYLQWNASWRAQVPQARQHIYPRLAYTFSTLYRRRIDKSGFQALQRAALYLPGFSKSHAFVFSTAYQRVDTSNTIFTNNTDVARGYHNVFYTSMWHTGFNYHFPVAYPDWGFANLIYFRRVRSNLFFDYSFLQNKKGITQKPLRSAGLELYLDARVWNQLPVSFGVRYSYLMDALKGKRNSFDAIVPTDLIPF